MKIAVHRIVTGPLQENAYIVQKERNALIIDPGADADKIIQKINDLDVVPRAVLLTHTHFDHIGALDTIRNTYHIPAYVNQLEEEWLIDPNLNLSAAMNPNGQNVICEPAEFSLDVDYCTRRLGDIEFKVLPTPGHSIGSMSFYFDHCIFVGDVLFHHSIGSTQFPTGNMEQLEHTIKEQLYTLPDDTIVYPGHGQHTTIGEEKKHNPYIKA